MQIVLLLIEIEKSRFDKDNAQYLDNAWSIQADIFSRQSEALREIWAGDKDLKS